MWSAVQSWIDGSPPTHDPVARARRRVQHLVVLLLHLVGIPYAVLWTILDRAWASGVLSVVIVAATVGLFAATRRGRPHLGGLIVSGGFFLTISVGLIARCGMTSNAAAWLLLAPVLAFMMVGPRHGVVVGIATAVEFVGMWGLEAVGVPFPPPLDPWIANAMIPVDFATIALSLAGILWTQSGVWDGVIDQLDEANTSLVEQVRVRQEAEDKALAAARARTTFLATMSHEIRTPLNGVLGLTEVLLDSELDADQRQLAATVQGSGRLLRALLDDVLDYSKIDSGQLDLERVPFDLEQTCEEIVRLWGATADERGIELSVQWHPSAPPWVVGDPTRLRQILGNLVSNALKFTEKGHVWIMVSTVDGELIVSVQDTGIGIPASSLDRIFDPFRQADASTTRKHGGTGLGLAICTRLAQALGGSLAVESTVGEGATFTIRLPFPAAETPETHPQAKASTTALQGTRVLVAEDNPVNRMVVSRLLERLGVEVLLAADGEACVHMWRKERPDLILMDCQMPVCDGYEATTHLRAEGAKVAIIALTANTMPGDRARCLDAGMDDHIGKPIRPEELTRTLLRWVAAETRRKGA